MTASQPQARPSREAAEAAVRTLLRWAGDDPEREGLSKTPARVVRAFEEYFAGYAQDPAEILATRFSEVAGYRDLVLLKDIPFESHCEHHLAPVIGRAHLAYLPANRVVGISKLARLVDVFAKRLQIQERLTSEIADALEKELNPRGLGVVIDAEHYCIKCRGVHKPGVSMTTKQLRGLLAEDASMRHEFLSAIT